MKKIIAIVTILVLMVIAIYIIRSNISSVNSPRNSLDYYKSLRLGTPFSEIVNEIGSPDYETGSGIHIFVYKLSDGNEVWLGYAGLQGLFYVKEKLSNGEVIDLVSK